MNLVICIRSLYGLSVPLITVLSVLSLIVYDTVLIEVTLILMGGWARGAGFWMWGKTPETYSSIWSCCHWTPEVRSQLWGRTLGTGVVTDASLECVLSNVPGGCRWWRGWRSLSLRIKRCLSEPNPVKRGVSGGMMGAFIQWSVSTDMGTESFQTHQYSKSALLTPPWGVTNTAATTP